MFMPISLAFAADDISADVYTEPSVQESVYNMNVDWKFRKAEPGYEKTRVFGAIRIRICIPYIQY